MKINGWDIPNSFLKNYKKDKEYKIFENKNILILLYNIEEVRMGWPLARVIIVKNKVNPKLLLEDSHFSIFVCQKSVQFFYNKYISLTTYFYDKKQNSVILPFLFIDIEKESFSIFRIKNSIHYMIKKGWGRKLKLKLIYSDKNFPNRDKEIIDLQKLKWQGCNDLNSIISNEYEEKTDVINTD